MIVGVRSLPDGRTLTCFAVWLTLTSLQLGLVPGAEYAWGFNFWQYLPPACSWLLAAASLALCSGRVRDLLLAGASRAWRRARPREGAGPALLAWVLLSLALWLLRGVNGGEFIGK